MAYQPNDHMSMLDKARVELGGGGGGGGGERKPPTTTHATLHGERLRKERFGHTADAA
jgi:hypothetical protein